ncbi:MAG: hypothetical protein QOH06_4561 [Acidobacteriota bacterium]|jgi:hypothetical protein|nr:hypothetical protein [Acidobacteriota bacterium]
MNTLRCLLVLPLLLAACTAPSGPGGSAASGGEAPFRFRLTVRETYSAGEPVTVGFFLENLSSEPLRVLTWYTPLEGIRGSIFRVTRDGQEVPYQGPMVKRGDPGQGDYVLVPPGGPVSAEVDLAQSWDPSVSGTYRVDFDGRIHDVAREGESVPRPRDAHQGMDAKGEPVTFRVVRP